MSTTAHYDACMSIVCVQPFSGVSSTGSATADLFLQDSSELQTHLYASSRCLQVLHEITYQLTCLACTSSLVLEVQLQSTNYTTLSWPIWSLFKILVLMMSPESNDAFRLYSLNHQRYHAIGSHRPAQCLILSPVHLQKPRSTLKVSHGTVQ